MTPSKIVAEKGHWLNLMITTDHPVEFRISGIDYESRVEPAGSTYDAHLGIRMDRAGRFEIEDGDSDKKMGTLVVTRDR